MNVTGTGIAVALAVIVALGFLFFGTTVFRSPASMTATTTDQSASTTLPMNDMNPQASNEPLPTTLTVTDTVVGNGATAVAGKQVTLNYVGMLPDGTVFDASANHGQPLSFTLGAGRVIKGWDEGIAGMKVGGKRHLIIPPDMAYGNQAVGNIIPANATLVFDVELVAVQ